MTYPSYKSWSFDIVSGSRVGVNPSTEQHWSTTNTNAASGNQGYVSGFTNPHPYLDGNAVMIENDRITPGLANGQRWRYPTWWQDTYTNMNWIPTPSVTYNTGCTFDTIESVLARSNPSRPVVNVPVFLFELRELPELFKIAGRSIATAISGSTINWLFGWRPLINDLRGLFAFQAAVDRRVLHLSSMYKRGGLSFTAPMGTCIQQDNWSNWLTYEGKQVRYRRVGVTRRWGHVKWVPDRNLRDDIPEINQTRRAAFQAVLGLKIDPSTVWEALPWTWLIDWFTTTGDYLALSRNVVGFVPGKCYVMTHAKADLQIEGNGVQYPELTYTLPSRSREGKIRAVASPSPFTVQLPLLNKQQWGILGSLAILRKQAPKVHL